jgi:tRNA(fMet)-specific endonuclease VapC
MSPRYSIDTDIFIHYRQQRSPALRAKFERLQPGEAVISVVVYGELLFGVEKSANQTKARKLLEEMISLTSVMPMMPEVAHEYGVLRATLAKSGEIIGNNDLWIAAHALAEGLIMVTNNEREFRRVPGLKVQNWAT